MNRRSFAKPLLASSFLFLGCTATVDIDVQASGGDESSGGCIDGDPECDAECGNGILEPGEECDGDFMHPMGFCDPASCQWVCAAGWATCYEGMPDLGCETYLPSDPNNCGFCGNSCGGETCVNGTCQQVDEDVHAAAVWVEPAIGDRLAMFFDGTIHAYNLDGMAQNFDPGGMGVPVMTPGGRVSIGDNDLAIGGFEDRRAVDQPGNLAWEWIGLGCCHDVNNAIGGDGFFYTTNVDQVWAVDEDTGTLAWNQFGPASGHVSIAGDGVYVASSNGELARWNRMTQTVEWIVPIDPSPVAPVAINHMDEVAARTDSGELAAVGPGGGLYFVQPANATAGPLIRFEHEIVIGTGFGAIQAWDMPGGGPMWEIQVGPGPVRDVLLAENDVIIGATDDEIVLSRPDGQLLRRFNGLNGVSEMLLHQGILYVIGNGELFALPVPEVWGYDLMSSWPVLHHDNRRTANRDKAQLP